MWTARHRCFELYVAVVLSGSTLIAGSLGDVGAASRADHSVTRALITRPRSSIVSLTASPLHLSCAPYLCTINTAVGKPLGWVTGHIMLPDTNGRANGRIWDVTNRSTAFVTAESASRSPETITITGTALLSAANAEIDLETPLLPTTGSNGPDSTMTPAGALVFSNVPVVINSTFVITFTEQSPAQTRVARFHLLPGGKH